ncbi:hypothetical protein EVS84_19065 [Pseudomonas koreensis]|uniref:Uncharacterized protein n=1 Tax=Pseudomonas koreensis TaxID=198620 RepID=A0A4Q4L0X8_9PSED|nr:hypothetical protein EVS84_19065 [Pseudomonas koreensis]
MATEGECPYSECLGRTPSSLGKRHRSTSIAPMHIVPVGAGLPAIAVCQATFESADIPSSLASQLPQGLCAVHCHHWPPAGRFRLHQTPPAAAAM